MAMPNEMEKKKQTDNELLDLGLIERLQNEFCQANNIYLGCVQDETGYVIKPYGSERELEFLRQRLDASFSRRICQDLENQSVENVIELTQPLPYLKAYGLAIRVDGKVQIIWSAAAVILEKIRPGDEVPDYMMRTTEDSFLKSLKFLELLSKQVFAMRMDELIAKDAIQSTVESERKIKNELKRTETMTEVVKMLESEKGFVRIVDDILAIVCDYMDIEAGSLLQLQPDGKMVDMICEFDQNPERKRAVRFQNVAKEKLPFFHDKPYLISSNTVLPEKFRVFFEEHGIKAGVFLPIEHKQKQTMYLCFCEYERERIWDVKDMKFLNDVKRIIQSILAKRIAKNSLASSYASLEAILENVGCGIYVMDPEKRTILYANQRFQKLFGTSIEAGKLDQIIYSKKDTERDRFFEEVYSPEEEKWFDFYKTHIEWVDGRAVSLCTVYDVTDKKQYQKKIEKQANNDFLTGLYNRMRCEQDLERFIAQAKDAGSEGALLYLDLDDFKHINDGLGHQYGDILLKAISKNLKRINGVESTCYRMGGDEFIIIVTNSKMEQLDKICNDISDIFRKPWYLKGSEYYCTMSMGIVKFPTDGGTVEEVIQKADIALFEAKRNGKNRITYYDEQDEASSYRRLDLEKNMRNATMNACREFEVFYQPVVDITTDGTICHGAEALIRWNSEEMGFISPADFIPLAEYLGLINPIGEYVLGQAAARCKYWNDMGHPDYRINVNLSVVQLLQNDIVEKIRRVLEKTGLNPKNLTLEVTESLAINDMERMKWILGQIKELGVKVALDDFGTGYSSLNHIREMPIDIIKIDRCFIEHIAEDDFSDAFVKMVAELASTIGVSICVEGVEENEQLEMIRRMKIAYGQGYLFGKPLPLEKFEQQFVFAS